MSGIFDDAQYKKAARKKAADELEKLRRETLRFVDAINEYRAELDALTEYQYPHSTSLARAAIKRARLDLYRAGVKWERSTK